MMSPTPGPTQLLDRAKEENEQTFTRLVQQLRSPSGVIPFVGAGMSAPLKFPQWSAFLNRHSGHLNQAARKRVDEACSQNKLDLAAGLIEQAAGKEQFQAAIEESFGDARLSRADLRAPRHALITFLASGPVITTTCSMPASLAATGDEYETSSSRARPAALAPFRSS